MSDRDADASAWPEIVRAIGSAASPARVLAGDPDRGAGLMAALGVTERSWLGSLALHTGGLVLDHGWVRILGGGGELPALSTNTRAHLVVGHDVLGGVFAIDAGGLDTGTVPAAPGRVCYWSPDGQRWEDLGTGHAAWVSAFLAGATTEFYGDWRWPGWEAEVEAVPLDRMLSLHPPPWSEQGHDLAEVSRRAVPLAEVLDLVGPPV